MRIMLSVFLFFFFFPPPHYSCYISRFAGPFVPAALAI